MGAASYIGYMTMINLPHYTGDSYTSDCTDDSTGHWRTIMGGFPGTQTSISVMPSMHDALTKLSRDLCAILDLFSEDSDDDESFVRLRDLLIEVDKAIDLDASRFHNLYQNIYTGNSGQATTQTTSQIWQAASQLTGATNPLNDILSNAMTALHTKIKR